MRRVHVLRSSALGLLIASGVCAAFIHASPQPGRRVYLKSGVMGLQFDRADRMLALFGPSMGSDGRSTISGGAAYINVRTGALSGEFTIPDTPFGVAVDARAHRAFVTVARDVFGLGADSVAEDVHTFDLDTGRRLRSMVLTRLL